MEPFLADLINNPKIPKSIRIIMITVVIGFLEFLFIIVAIGRGTIYAMPVGILMAVVFLTAYIFLLIRILCSKGGAKSDEENIKEESDHETGAEKN